MKKEKAKKLTSEPVLRTGSLATKTALVRGKFYFGGSRTRGLPRRAVAVLTFLGGGPRPLGHSPKGEHTAHTLGILALEGECVNKAYMVLGEAFWC